MSVKIKLGVDAPLIGNPNVVLQATSWEVSEIPAFNIESKIVHRTLNDSVNLLSKTIEHDLDEYTTLYFRAKYHFNIGNSSWSKTIPINLDHTGIKMSSNVINTPGISINISDDVNDEVLKVTGSDFSLFTGTGNHRHTDWVLKSTQDEIIYTSLEDSSNLSKIDIPLSYIESGKIYMMEVTYVSTIGDRSNTGRQLVSLSTESSKLFEMETECKLIPERWMYFKLFVYTSNYISVDLIITDKYGNVVNQSLNQTSRNPRIFTENVITGGLYNVKARLNTLGGNKTDYKTIYTGVCSPKEYIDIDGTTYIDDYDYLHSYTMGGATHQVSVQLECGDIILSKVGSDKLFLNRYDGDRIVEIKELATLDDRSINHSNPVNIIPLPNGNIVVDYVLSSESGKNNIPVFKVYEYNPYSRTLLLNKSFDRLDEYYNTAISASAIGMSDNNVWYIPHALRDNAGNYLNLTMRVFDTNINPDNELIEITLPVSVESHMSLVTVDFESLYLIGGAGSGDTYRTKTNNLVYTYDVVNSQFSSVANLSAYTDIDNYNYHAMPRKDGLIALFNSVTRGAHLDNQDVLVFNPSDNSITTHYIDVPDNIPYTNTLRLINGDIVRITSNTIDPQNVYRYVADSINANDVDTGGVIEPNLHLHVLDGEVIVIESPYTYESITIDCDGELRWNDGGTLRTFFCNDLIITRDTDVSYNVCEGVPDYNSITVLEDVTYNQNYYVNVPDDNDCTIEPGYELDTTVIGDNSSLTVNSVIPPTNPDYIAPIQLPKDGVVIINITGGTGTDSNVVSYELYGFTMVTNDVSINAASTNILVGESVVIMNNVLSPLTEDQYGTFKIRSVDARGVKSPGITVGVNIDRFPYFLNRPSDTKHYRIDNLFGGSENINNPDNTANFTVDGYPGSLINAPAPLNTATKEITLDNSDIPIIRSVTFLVHPNDPNTNGFIGYIRDDTISPDYDAYITLEGTTLKVYFSLANGDVVNIMGEFDHFTNHPWIDVEVTVGRWNIITYTISDDNVFTVYRNGVLIYSFTTSVDRHHFTPEEIVGMKDVVFGVNTDTTVADADFSHFKLESKVLTSEEAWATYLELKPEEDY